MVMLVRQMIKLFWIIVPHRFRSSGQFSSGICSRCGKPLLGWHV
jgi:hypothetical protein